MSGSIVKDNFETISPVIITLDDIYKGIDMRLDLEEGKKNSLGAFDYGASSFPLALVLW
jgi:hypothetical protein